MSSKGSFLQQASDEAPTAGFAPVNYGKLLVTPMVATFGKGEDKHAKPTRAPYKDGQKLEPNQTLELEIIVNISELNPALSFEYKRQVRIQKSGRIKSDWAEIVLPSLEKVFGENWGDAILKGPYVEVEDVDNILGTVVNGKVLGVPKFIRAFKSKAECVAAREARFGSAAASSSGSTGAAIPEKVVENVSSLLKSVGEEATRTMLAGHPFGEYDVDELIAAAAG